MESSDTLLDVGIGELYREHHGWLRNWLRYRVGCHENAADLAQDVFLRLFKTRETRALRQPRAYLSSIARGLMIDQYRRRVLEQAYLDSLAHLAQSQLPSEEERLLVLDVLDRLDRLLGQLKPRVREAFLLAQLDGLTCPQIAERLGVSRATVERDLARALHACYQLYYADA